jgi:pilus assembly protein CpaF
MEGDVVTMQEIFVFERQGMSPEGAVLGRFHATGIRPKAADRLAAYGISLNEMMFMDQAANGREPGKFAP